MIFKTTATVDCKNSGCIFGFSHYMELVGFEEDTLETYSIHGITLKMGY